jgi:hypothetical protein
MLESPKIMSRLSEKYCHLKKLSSGLPRPMNEITKKPPPWFPNRPTRHNEGKSLATK